MDIQRISSLSACVFLILFASVLGTRAQSTRTWVSGVGDDVNPCSRTAPCKTFAGAISKTAGGGEINCIDSAGFGAVTVVKSVTIDCTGTLGSILAAQTNGIIINIAPDSQDVAKTVRIRGISINGAGNGLNGIRIIAAAKVFVENTVLDGFLQNGISIENVTATTQVSVYACSIRNVKGAAISSFVTGGSETSVSDSLFSGNATAVSAGANSVVRLSNNSITFNKVGLSSTGTGKIISYKNNLLDGNGTNGSPTSTISLQ